MRQLADDGKVILMVSSELPEIITVCDRIAVFCEGRLTQILTNRDDMSEEEIMAWAFHKSKKRSEREETVQLCAVLGINTAPFLSWRIIVAIFGSLSPEYFSDHQ